MANIGHGGNTARYKGLGELFRTFEKGVRVSRADWTALLHECDESLFLDGVLKLPNLVFGLTALVLGAISRLIPAYFPFTVSKNKPVMIKPWINHANDRRPRKVDSRAGLSIVRCPTNYLNEPHKAKDVRVGRP